MTVEISERRRAAVTIEEDGFDILLRDKTKERDTKLKKRGKLKNLVRLVSEK